MSSVPPPWNNQTSAQTNQCDCRMPRVRSTGLPPPCPSCPLPRTRAFPIRLHGSPRIPHVLCYLSHAAVAVPAHSFGKYVFSFLFSKHLRAELLGRYTAMFNFVTDLKTLLPKCLYHFVLCSVLQEYSSCRILDKLCWCIFSLARIVTSHCVCFQN